MKQTIFVVLAAFAMPAFAVTTGSSTSINGNGIQFNAQAAQTVGTKTATITIGNGATPKFQTGPGAGPGVDAGSFSAGLSVGATLGGGRGSTSGSGSTSSGAQPFSF